LAKEKFAFCRFYNTNGYLLFMPTVKRIKTPMTISFRPDDLERLKKYCDDQDLHVSQVARWAIKEYLDRMTGAKLAKKT
jgi:site-specific recombinase XerD